VTKVKICGLVRPEDAEHAIESGANALGFVFEEGSPRYAKTHLEVIQSLGPYAMTVAVFGRLHQAVLENSGCKVAQFETAHPWPPGGMTSVITLRLQEGWTSEEAVRRLRQAESLIQNGDAILIDAYHPTLAGGTGHRVDWDLAAFIVESTRTPVILAGGLTPDNVAEAIQKVRPYAVDVSSGIESSPGIKDHLKMRDFIRAAKGAL
jgi:phosphoribosylanthranilate isomerase